MTVKDAVEAVGVGIDVVGVSIIVVGVAVATARYIASYFSALRDPRARSVGYRQYRIRLARAILLGLEFLVASDIIRTVAISATFESVGVLAGIVLIRTFLSLALEVEVEGRWPWQPMRSAPEGDGE